MVDHRLKLSKRIYFGKDWAVSQPKHPPPMARSATAFLPSAPMVYAVISDPGIVDNPDIPSYQPHVYGRCDPPALIPLQMNARNVHNAVNQPEWRSPGTDTGLEGLFLSSFHSVRVSLMLKLGVLFLFF